MSAVTGAAGEMCGREMWRLCGVRPVTDVARAML